MNAAPMTPERLAEIRRGQKVARSSYESMLNYRDIVIKDWLPELLAEVDRLTRLADMYREHTEHYRSAANEAQEALDAAASPATGTEYGVRAGGRVMDIRSGHGDTTLDGLVRRDQEARAARYRDMYPDAALVTRTATYSQWTEAES